MPVIALTTPLYTESQLLADRLARNFGLRRFKDQDILELTGQEHGLSPQLLRQTVQGHPIPFNNFTHEREKALAALGMTLAGLIRAGHCLFTGILGHLIPGFVTHVFHVLVLTDPKTRVAMAMAAESADQDSAQAMVQMADQESQTFVSQLKGRSLADPGMYHRVVETCETPWVDPEMAAIQDALGHPPFSGSVPRDRELADLMIWARTCQVLAPLGNGLLVESEQGHVVITIDRKRMDLPKTQTQILAAVGSVPGVATVKTRIGPNYYKGEMIRNFDFGSSTGHTRWDNKEKNKR